MKRPRPRSPVQSAMKLRAVLGTFGGRSHVSKAEEDTWTCVWVRGDAMPCLRRARSRGALPPCCQHGCPGRPGRAAATRGDGSQLAGTRYERIHGVGCALGLIISSSDWSSLWGGGAAVCRTGLSQLVSFVICGESERAGDWSKGHRFARSMHATLLVPLHSICSLALR